MGGSVHDNKYNDNHNIWRQQKKAAWPNKSPFHAKWCGWLLGPLPNLGENALHLLCVANFHAQVLVNAECFDVKRPWTGLFRLLVEPRVANMWCTCQWTTTIHFGYYFFSLWLQHQLLPLCPRETEQDLLPTAVRKYLSIYHSLLLINRTLRQPGSLRDCMATRPHNSMHPFLPFSYQEPKICKYVCCWCCLIQNHFSSIRSNTLFFQFHFPTTRRHWSLVSFPHDLQVKRKPSPTGVVLWIVTIANHLRKFGLVLLCHLPVWGQWICVCLWT